MKLLLLLLAACQAAPGMLTEEAKVCAAGATIEGIDVSVYQGTIDWTKVRAAGVEFAIIRVSDGASHADTRFAANWAGARQAGVLRGAYQFLREDQDPVAQADVFLEAMGALEDDDLAPSLDVESTDGQTATKIASNVGAWIARVEAATGRKPIIYSGKYFWNGSVGASAAYTADPLWIPQWGVTCPDLPTPWADWALHQYSATGRIDGITGDVDRDHFNGDRAALMAFIGVVAAVPDAPPAPAPDAPVVAGRPDAGPVVGAVPVGLTGGCATGGGRGGPVGALLVLVATLALRRRVLAGEVVTLPATDASRALVDHVQALADRHLGDDFASLTALRRRVADDTRDLVAAMLRAHGCPDDTEVDALRLRAVRSGGHRDPAAAPAYAFHRDTWFANPAAQLNWWLPLADVSADSTFAIYPAYLARPVANSSAEFDLARLEQAGGFGAGAAAPRLHPTVLEPVDTTQELRVTCRRAETVVFAGAHLHRTLPNDSGRTRLSVDVRTVCPGDVGPPRIDDRSRGSAGYQPLR